MLRVWNLIVVWLWSFPLWAWGGLGHYVTAAIALRQLNPSTLMQVRNILGREDFVQASTWADGIKKDNSFKQTYTYHFASIPDRADYLETLAGLSPVERDKGDVLMAILKAQSVLRDGVATAAQKKYSLKFLIHFLGDLHQPLHTGRPEDRGGNDVPLHWFGHEDNLHHVWDTSIMETAHAEDFKGKSPRERATWYADFLESRHRPPPCDPDIEAWLNQALKLRPVAYDQSGKDSSTHLSKALPIVEEQLALAGHHMACALNSLFADAAVVPEKERSFRTRMERALRATFEDWIRLHPG